jgi:hypothetical protein
MEKPRGVIEDAERSKMREKIQGNSLFCLNKENKCREKLFFF